VLDQVEAPNLRVFGQDPIVRYCTTTLLMGPIHVFVFHIAFLLNLPLHFLILDLVFAPQFHSNKRKRKMVILIYKEHSKHKEAFDIGMGLKEFSAMCSLVCFQIRGAWYFFQIKLEMQQMFIAKGWQLLEWQSSTPLIV
ncbi:hypothetical protein ACJX0J_024880, partial [Zea mays]